MNDEFDTSEFYEDPLESERQAQWEEEAHYWHTVMAFVDLIEQHGYDKLMADVGYTFDRREADRAVKYSIEGICPKGDMSFLSIRKGADNE